MVDIEKKEETTEHLVGKNSVFNVEAQKEIIEFGAKVRMQQSIKTLLIVFPLVAIFVCVLLYVVFKFVGII